ncbi:MAG: hypothetical protein HKN32_07460, partial [Flavobacteriales bacterium]|nr:hypothetical protein [Flavobacteriales bacterium]
MLSNFTFRTVITLALFCGVYSGQAQEFQRAYGGAGFDVISRIVQLEDQSYLAFGSSSSYSSSSEAAVIHLDGMGNVIEGRLYSFLVGSDISATYVKENGNIIFGGGTSSLMSNSAEALVGEMTPEGEVLWAKILGGAGNETITCLAMADNGCIIAGGHSSSFSADESFNDIVIKLSSEGDVLWSYEFESPGYDRIADIEVTPEGQIVFFGHHVNDDSQSYDLHLIGLNSDGSVDWSRAIGGPTVELASEMLLMDDGFLLGGDTDSFGVG